MTSNGVNKTYDYDPYGNPTYFAQYSANDTNPIRYSGEYYDSESGLIYLRNRYYNPSIGRFINEDPIRDGFNWYAYCGGNPIMFVDPLGFSELLLEAVLDDLGGSYSYNDYNDTLTISIPGYADRVLETFSTRSSTVTVNGTISGFTTTGSVGGHIVVYSSFFEDVYGMASLSHNPGDDFSSIDLAALAWAITYDTSSYNYNTEYASAIYKKTTGKYSFTLPFIGTVDTVQIPYARKSMGERVAIIHSHGSYDPIYDSEVFSDADKTTAEFIKCNSYLVTPAGYLKRFSYRNGKVVNIANDLSKDPKLWILEWGCMS